MWALECQKVSRPSSLSKVNNLRSQSPSKGLVMSHRTPFTCEINAFAAKLLEISLATSIGEVTHFLPSLTVPSGNVILNKKRNHRKAKRNQQMYTLVTGRGVGLFLILLDGIGGEGLTLSDLLGLDGLEELDAFGDDRIEVGFVFGVTGDHVG